MRTCEHCGTPLARKYHEPPHTFEARRFCDSACVNASRRREAQPARQPLRITFRHLEAGDDQDLAWQQYANCLGVDPDLFFPERGVSTREAKEVCRGCVVREACLEYAIVHAEKFGIWGGLSERERRRIRRERALRRVAS